MLRGPETWDKIAIYFRHVITKKREKVVEMQLIEQNAKIEHWAKVHQNTQAAEQWILGIKRWIFDAQF